MSIPLTFETSFEIDKCGKNFIEVAEATELQIKTLLLSKQVVKNGTKNSYPLSIKNIHETPFSLFLNLDSMLDLINAFGDKSITIYNEGNSKILSKKDLYKFII